MELTPQHQVARQFMNHKGYYHAEPYDVLPLAPGEPCWYFLYELPEGILELEVFWNGKEWLTTVTSFSIDDPDIHTAS